MTTATRPSLVPPPYPIARMETEIAWEAVENAETCDELERAFAVWWRARCDLRRAVIDDEAIG